MVIRVSLALPHNLLCQAIESFLDGQADIVLEPLQGSICRPYQSPQNGASAELPNFHHPAHASVLLVGADSPCPSLSEQVRMWRSRYPDWQLVVLTDFQQSAELLSTVNAGALACVSTTSQLDDVLQAIRCAARGEHYLCSPLSSLMLQGVRQPQPSRERHGLGLREEQVLRLIADGYSSKEIARRLDIAPSTVDVHRRNIMRKIGLHKVADLTRFAIRHQMVAI
jgi:two-component system NarL family response regulator